ncbi:MAG: VOC family protein [Cyanobacteria bacterium J06641_5]
MFNKFHHIAIICSDYKTSRNFYTDKLGFKVIAETYRENKDSWKLDLALPNGDAIELFSFPAPPSRPNQPEACGLRHLSFEVDDVAAIKSTLESQGINVEAIRIDEFTGKRFTFFKDPDGLPLEVYEA